MLLLRAVLQYSFSTWLGLRCPSAATLIRTYVYAGIQLPIVPRYPIALEMTTIREDNSFYNLLRQLLMQY